MLALLERVELHRRRVQAGPGQGGVGGCHPYVAQTFDSTLPESQCMVPALAGDLSATNAYKINWARASTTW